MTEATIEAQERVIDALPDDKTEAYAILVCSVEAILWSMVVPIEDFVKAFNLVREQRGMGVKPSVN